MFINPKVHIDGNVLHARTSFEERVLFLFCFDKKVEVDQTNRIIRVASRSFWFFNSDISIPFDRITDLETKAWSEKNNMGTERFTYSIVLVLENPREKYTLINFKDGFTSAKDTFQQYFDMLRKYLGRDGKKMISRSIRGFHKI